MTERGSVLIMTVWAVSLLSLLAAGLGSRGIFTAGLSDRLEEGLRARLIAEGVAAASAAALKEDLTQGMDNLAELRPLMDDWAGSFEPEAKVDIGKGLVDEDRKLNLNTAPADVLRTLFTAAGARGDEAERIAAAVIDWRDEDDDESDQGAEGIHYRGLADGYDCKDGPLESVEELLLVRGVTPELWSGLAPHVTVHGSGALNLNTASEGALTALGLSRLGVDSLLTYRAGEDDKEGTPDDRVFGSVESVIGELRAMPEEDKNRLSGLHQSGFLGVGSSAFRVSVTVQLQGAAHPAGLDCVVDRKGRVLAWRER